MTVHTQGLNYYNDDFNEIGMNSNDRYYKGGLSDDANGGKYTLQTESAGISAAHNNMPPYYVLTYIIKL